MASPPPSSGWSIASVRRAAGGRAAVSVGAHRREVTRQRVTERLYCQTDSGTNTARMIPTQMRV
jgi:hypothetical protein